MNFRGFNFLYFFVKCGNLKIFKEIFEYKVDIEIVIVDGWNSLYIVVFYGSFFICKYILENCKDLFDVIDRYNMNLVYWVVFVG